MFICVTSTQGNFFLKIGVPKESWGTNFLMKRQSTRSVMLQSSDLQLSLQLHRSYFSILKDFTQRFNDIPVDTGRKLNVYKTFRRGPGRLLNVLCTFNLRLVSTRIPIHFCSFFTLFFLSCKNRAQAYLEFQQHLKWRSLWNWIMAFNH